MDSVSGVGVLDKSVAVLGALASRPLSLSELVAVSGLARATAHRLAVALEAHGLVRREGDSLFALGPRLVVLGHLAEQQFPLVGLARPVLEALRDSTGESVQLYVREASGRRCLISYQSPHGLATIVAEGALLPLERGSAGRVLAGEAPQQGWIESAEEREPGVASVSAGVGVPAWAAVSLSGPIARVGHDPGRRFGQPVAAAAGELAALLFTRARS